MVKVKIVKLKDSIKEINITGHANFADAGKDIVCAGISSICIGLLNSIDEMARESSIITINEDQINIKVVNNSQLIQNILNVGYYQLKTVEEQYPENLKIKSEKE